MNISTHFGQLMFINYHTRALKGSYVLQGNDNIAPNLLFCHIYIVLRSAQVWRTKSVIGEVIKVYVCAKKRIFKSSQQRAFKDTNTFIIHLILTTDLHRILPFIWYLDHCESQKTQTSFQIFPTHSFLFRHPKPEPLNPSQESLLFFLLAWQYRNISTQLVPYRIKRPCVFTNVSSSRAVMG